MPKGKTPRKFASSLKFQLVLESLKDESSQAEIVRAYQVDPKLISLWKWQFLKNGSLVFESSKGDEESQKIDELEKLIDKQTVEIIRKSHQTTALWAFWG